MLELLIPLGLVAGCAIAIVKTTPATPESTAQPEFPPETKALFLDTATVDGAVVQTFKPDMASTVLRSLAGFAVEEQTVEAAKAGRLLFKLVPSKGDCSATQAALQAQANGFLVLGSLSLALETTTADQLLAFVPPTDRALAATNFAVLLEALGESSSASAAAAPPPAPRFDASMPVEIVREIESLLREEDVPVDVLRRIAVDLDDSTMPLGAAAVRRRADALELQRRIASWRALPAAPQEDRRLVEVLDAKNTVIAGVALQASPAATGDAPEIVSVEISTVPALEQGQTQSVLEQLGATAPVELAAVELEHGKTAVLEDAGKTDELEHLERVEVAPPVLSLVSSTPELERADAAPPRQRSLRPRTAL